MLVATETSSAEEAHALIEDGLVPDFILTDHISDRTSTDLPWLLKQQ
jgi:hypothetical protein